MSKKNKIIFLLPHLNGGGAERVALTLLRSMNKDKFAPILVVLNKTNDLLHLVPNDVELIDLKIKRVSKSFGALKRLINKLQPDYVFTTHYTTATALFSVKPFVGKFVHIARIPGSPSKEKEHHYYGRFKRWLFGVALRSANIVIAQTKEMKAEAISIFKINENKCSVLHNPIDKEFIRESLEGQNNPFDKAYINIIASGRLHAVKGYDILIQAFEQLNAIQNNTRLFILGSDKGEKMKLDQLVKQLHLSDKVLFLGFIENPYPYYAHCDLFVLSSIHEGFPNSLLENYYLNSPILSTKCVPIVEELISDGVNGYLVQVNDEKMLSEKLNEALQLKRSEINNPNYQSKSLEDFI